MSPYEKTVVCLANSVKNQHFCFCSEDTVFHCHRRLVAEYFRQKWGDVEITHL